MCPTPSTPTSAAYDKDDGSNPSSHTTYGNLHTLQKDACLSHLHEENRKAELHILCFKRKLLLAASEDGVKLNNELHNDIKILAETSTKQVHSSHSEDSFLRLFWD